MLSNKNFDPVLSLLEQDNKHAYEARVCEVDLDCFTLLGFSTSGGLGPAANIIDYRLASLTAEKNDQPLT